jgi:hypothetical protein
MTPRHVALSLAVAGALLASPGTSAIRAEDPPPEPEYVMFDLGDFAPAAINDRGDMLLNSSSGAPVAFVGTLNERDELEIRIVPPVFPGPVIGRALTPDGNVVGISRAGEDLDFGSPPMEPGVLVPYDRGFRTVGGGHLVLEPFVFPGYQSPSAQRSEGWAVNASGLVAGDSTTVSNFEYRATTWGGDGKPKVLSTSLSRARGINSAGKVVGFTREGFPTRVTLWYQGGEFPIDLPDSFSASAADINDKDQVVGSRDVLTPGNPPYPHAFLTQLDGVTVASNVDLGVLPTGRDSAATAINEEGVVVGHSSALVPKTRPEDPDLFEYRAVRWKARVIAELKALVDPESPGILFDTQSQQPVPFELTTATAINEAGDILCTGTQGGSPANHAYLLRARVTGLSVSPRAVAFGEVPAGDTAEQAIVVTNRSAETQRVRLGRTKKPFAVTGETKFILAPGEQRTVTVRAGVKDDGDFSGELVFSADLAAPVTASLSVTGVPPIAIDPATVDFGRTWGKGVRDVTLTNRRNVRVTAGIFVGKRAFALPGGKNVVLEALQSKTVQVEFAPTVVPETVGALTVKPDAARAAPSSATLRGQGASTLRVRSVTGEVTIRHGVGPFDILEEGDELAFDAEIATGIESGVTVVFPDGGTMDLRQLTQLRVATLVLAPDRRDVEIQLRVGQMKAEITPQKSIDTNFDVATPTATASVRGTTFDVIYDEATGTSTTRVTEGKVLVTPADPLLKKVMVKAGKQVHVTSTTISALEAYIP